MKHLKARNRKTDAVMEFLEAEDGGVKALQDEVRHQAAELRDWNAKLEDRVRKQVSAIERLGPSVQLSSRALDASEQAGDLTAALRHGLDLLIYRPRDAQLRARVAALAERAGDPDGLARALRVRPR